MPTGTTTPLQQMYVMHKIFTALLFFFCVQYYRDTEGGAKTIAEDLLLTEKKLVPSKIHYILHASKEFPGIFLTLHLAFQPV